MRSTVSMTLASACLVMISSTAGCRLNQAAERVLRTPCSTLGDVAEPDRRCRCATSTTMVLVFRGRAQLVVGADGDRRAVGAVERAERRLRVGAGDRGAHVLQADAHRGERAGLTRTRIAGCSAPLTVTSATPSTCAMRCAMTLSAAS